MKFFYMSLFLLGGCALAEVPTDSNCQDLHKYIQAVQDENDPGNVFTEPVTEVRHYLEEQHTEDRRNHSAAIASYLFEEIAETLSDGHVFKAGEEFTLFKDGYSSRLKFVGGVDDAQYFIERRRYFLRCVSDDILSTGSRCLGGKLFSENNIFFGEFHVFLKAE